MKRTQRRLTRSGLLAGAIVGQLLFISAILGLMALVRWINRRATIPQPDWLWRVAPYSIGVVAAFWMIQRIAAF